MNILIIEDDIFLVKNIVNTIKKHIVYHHIHTCSSYLDFLYELSVIHRYDAILLDIFLSDVSGKNGIDILQIFQKKHIHIPIIVMSNHSEYSLLERAFDLGACDYIIKPFRLQELILRIHKRYKMYLGGQFYFPGDILKYHELEFHTKIGQFFILGERLHLSRNNTYVLLLFFTYRETLLTHFFLQEKIWGNYNDNVQLHNLGILILRLKRQLSAYHLDNRIQNIHSQGYMFKREDI